MRSSFTPGVLLAIAALPAAALAQELNGGTFYEPEVAARATSGALGFGEHVTATPRHFSFLDKERLRIEWGNETEECRYKAAGKKPELTLELRCGGATDPKRVSWRWLETNRAETDLLGGTEVFVRIDQSWESILEKRSSKYAGEHLPGLASSYTEAGGQGVLDLGAGGAAELDGKTYEVRTYPCFESCVRTKKTVCVLLHAKGRKPIELFVEGDALIIAGGGKGLCVLGSAFERAKKPRRFEKIRTR